MIEEKDILPLLDFLWRIDATGGEVNWSCGGDYAPITFFVNCNDLFYWAAADGEAITRADIPAVIQAIADMEAAGSKTPKCDGLTLWCARHRGMRPQQPAYPREPAMRALFDACGPARTLKDEG